MRAGPESYRKPEDVDARLERIARLQGADPGIFVLAVHAFVEGWIRDRFDYQMADRPRALHRWMPSNSHTTRRTTSATERDVIRLTAEQNTILAQITLDKDFLAKGSAGTYTRN